MKQFVIKKIILVNSSTSLGECKSILRSDDCALGVINSEGECFGFVLRNSLLEALKFDISNQSVSLITTLADFTDTDIFDEKEFPLSFNEGLLIGKDRKQISSLIVKNSEYQSKTALSLKEQYERLLSDNVKQALIWCSTLADELNLPIFLIGGAVRDIILGRRSFDVDVTLQGDAIEFAQSLVVKYPDKCSIISVHDDFKTAKVEFLAAGEKIAIDLASTRKETYKALAGLPVVKEIGCDVCEDILRRDFTINSMALSLNKNSFCKLIDPLNGYEDLKNRIIKIIHPVSFVDDPTRIVRALKFAVRFDCALDETAQYLQNQCLASGIFSDVGTERMKSEIKQTFALDEQRCFDVFVEQKMYLFIDAEIEQYSKKLPLGREVKSAIEQHRDCFDKNMTWLVYFGCLLIYLSKEKIDLIAQKNNLSGSEHSILIEANELYKNKELLENSKSNFEVFEFFEKYSAESILLAKIAFADENLNSKADLYLKELKNIKLTVTGTDLIKAGLSAGPVFGEILREILALKLNGSIKTQNEERACLNQIVSKFQINKK